MSINIIHLHSNIRCNLCQYLSHLSIQTEKICVTAYAVLLFEKQSSSLKDSTTKQSPFGSPFASNSLFMQSVKLRLVLPNL